MENLKMIQMPMENNELAKLKRRIEIDEQIAALQAEKEEIDLYLINAINNSVDGKLTVGDKVASYVKESKSPYWTKDNLLDCHPQFIKNTPSIDIEQVKAYHKLSGELPTGFDWKVRRGYIKVSKAK